MITEIQLREFKSHRDTTVPLGRLTVLVGPNGSGKTSVLEALTLQAQLTHFRQEEVLFGLWTMESITRRGANRPVQVISKGLTEGVEWQAVLELGGVSPSVKLRWHEGGKSFDNGFQSESVVRGIGSAALYKLNAANIAAPAYSDQPGTDVDYLGSHTAVALASLKLGYDEVFARIEEELRQIIPNVKRVRLRQEKVKQGTQEVLGNKIFFDFRGAPGVPAHAASEGTLIVLALLTILHGPNRPNVLLLDDVAQSLHPHAQMELVKLLRRLLEANPELQIVATTHSPYVLDQVEPKDVHAFALRENGTAAVKCLAEHPEAEKLKGTMSAGQLWTLDPESEWVLKGQAD